MLQTIRKAKNKTQEKVHLRRNFYNKRIVIGLISFLIIGLISIKATTFRQQNLAAIDLKCEYLNNPRGILVLKPRLSWKMHSSANHRNQYQMAYRILVASTPKKLANDIGDIWESGKVTSNQSQQIEYKGKDLQSGMKYFWKVKIWNLNEEESDWSQTATWSMGLLSQKEWKANWIGLEKPIRKEDSTLFWQAARYFRKDFKIGKKLQRATIYTTGIGFFECYLNGEKLSDHIYSPSFSQYKKEIFYETFDVTEALNTGTNAIGIIVGNGRYYVPKNKHLNIAPPKMIFQLNLIYSDGSKASIVSDSSWDLSIRGPITRNSEYKGETYDARKEMQGWAEPNFDLSDWGKAEVVESPTQQLRPAMIDPSVVIEELQPKEIIETKPGVYVVDFGQNFSGWAKLKINGERGDSITLRYSELFLPDSSIMIKNLRSAKATDVYVCKGEGTEEYAPRFSQHGFRYVEIHGLSKKPSKNWVIGQVVHDRLAVTGSLKTSDTLVNRIMSATRWTAKSLYHSIPFDCPQRDERQGWLGDRGQTTAGESFLFDVSKFYTKWLADIQLSQKENGQLPNVSPKSWSVFLDNVTWPMTYLEVCHMLYNRYEDKRIVHQHYKSMKRWMDYMREKYMDKRNIISVDVYGDWSTPAKYPTKKKAMYDAKLLTRAEILASAYYYRGLKLMAEFADVVKLPEDRIAFEQQATNIKLALREEYIDTASFEYGNHTATEIILLLAFDIVDEKQKEQLTANLKGLIQGHHNGNIASGLIGMHWIMRTLSKNHLEDLAFQLLTNKDYPSWGYMIEEDATTLWETWNGKYRESHNHLMLSGDLLVWAYEHIGGIRPEKNGYQNFVLKPDFFEGLSFAKTSYESPYGKISSNWQLDGKNLKWDIEVPANTTAKIYIPSIDTSAIFENGKKINVIEGSKYLNQDSMYSIYSLGSGRYSFFCKNASIIKKNFDVAAPFISPKDTILSSDSSQIVKIWTPEKKQVKIRYTTDGSEPNVHSKLYTEPFEVNKKGHQIIKAIAIKDGKSSFVQRTIIDRYDSTINGWNYEYSEGIGDWESLQEYKQAKVKKSGRIADFDLKKIKMRDHYWGTHFWAYINLPQSGMYTFYLTSNDGATVKINDKVVVDNDGIHYSIQKSGKIYLEAGRHPIRIDHFNYYSFNSLRLLFSGPGFSKQKVPRSMIFFE